jgi:multidrug resistance efflux pump
MKHLKRIAVISIIMLVVLSGCDVIMAQEEGGLKASGVVEAVEVLISPEVGGKVAEVYAAEGDKVAAGDSLFLIENEILEAQLKQAQAGLGAAKASLDTAVAAKLSAEAALESAQASLDMANIQYELELALARVLDKPERIESWDEDLPGEFELPPWYFDKSEEIAAAWAEVEAAKEALEAEEEKLLELMDEIGGEELREAEERLARAQAAFLVAEELMDREIATNGKDNISDYVQDLYDAAEAELESAQKEYDSLLADVDSDALLEARARVAVAKERYEIALDNYYALLTGENALQLAIAEAAITQAEALVAQAEAALKQAEAGVGLAEKSLAQARAALDVVQIQVDKLMVTAEIDGVVLVRNVEPGELVSPGVTTFVIGDLDKLTITVFIAEDRYGEINLGDTATVTVDSFPDKEFEAVVTRIADEAEYTPRNVQTEEDRKTTVFAIELAVKDAEDMLKPGMSADISFGE